MSAVLPVKKEKGKCVGVCPIYPSKMVGSCECRGCRFHMKHDRKNTEVICNYSVNSEEGND